MLLYLNWSLTLITVAILAVFGGGMTVAFQRIRPLFRERGKLYAEVSGRLNETLGGIRVVEGLHGGEARAARVRARRRTSCSATSPRP